MLIALLLVAGNIVPVFLYGAIGIGIAMIVYSSIAKIRTGSYSLDYIALLAMIVALATDHGIAGGVIALMVTSGEALDAYASHSAEEALHTLADRIPKTCTVRCANGNTIERPIQEIMHGDTIIVRRHELVPLDGILVSDSACIDNAHLTGEAFSATYVRGARIRSGSINRGNSLEITVEGTADTSTYHRIVRLVEESKRHPSPTTRFAEKVNLPFTMITLVISATAYVWSGDVSRALAVLVMATPCPLLIAAPVAFIGGISRAARHSIIIKRPVSLEILDRVSTVFFDKTGTLTLGEPTLTKIERIHTARTDDNILSIAAAIELHSLHPLARAVVTTHRSKHLNTLHAHRVAEILGTGITGYVDDIPFSITSSHGVETGIVVSIAESGAEIARLHFEDALKEHVAHLFHTLMARGIHIEILTGDTRENAERIMGRFGIPIRAGISPEEKFIAIGAARTHGDTVAMVGDGLNDAPALAHADIGIVFSGTENSASIEAASIAILGCDISLLQELFDTAHTSVRIARQSMIGGIALSAIGMIFAACGYISPVAGALLQEIIDVIVILNALRTRTSHIYTPRVQ